MVTFYSHGTKSTVFWKAFACALITRQINSDLKDRSACYSGEKSIYIMKLMARATALCMQRQQKIVTSWKEVTRSAYARII
jgi:hypothetical protein